MMDTPDAGTPYAMPRVRGFKGIGGVIGVICIHEGPV
jgi:hypothetical protein